MPQPSQPQCSLVPASTRYASPELAALEYDGEDLVIRAEASDGTTAKLVFRDVIGFRVLDERDLLEFWNAYSAPQGWLWEVQSGGWFDLERTRVMFDSPSFYGAAKEYLIVGNKCASVVHRK